MGSREGANPEAADNPGQTLLSWAAKSGREAFVRLILEKGVDPNSNTGDGQAPLLWAAQNGHEATVRLLLENGADLESKTKTEETPLWWAAQNGHTATLKLLIENGANLEPRDQVVGRTPLGYAALRGDEAVVKLLLEKGADLECRDSFGHTPLSLAQSQGRDVIVRLLLEKGADTGALLSHAVQSGSLADVERLLGMPRTKVNSRDKDGRTPLSYAAQRGRLTVVKLLLAMPGIEVDSRDKDGQTPLSYAAANRQRETFDLLLKELGIFSGEGPTLLLAAVTDCQTSVLEHLLTDHFDRVAQGPYSWLTDLRDNGLEESELKDLLLSAQAAADDSGPWFLDNIPDIPEPEAELDTTFHQESCAHKCRDTRTSDNKKDGATSLDRFTEYVSREDMLTRVSLFCGLAGVTPRGLSTSSDFGVVSFYELATVGIPELRNQDTEDKTERLLVQTPAEDTQIAATVIWQGLSHARLISQLHRALCGLMNAAVTLQQTGFCCNQFTVVTAGKAARLPDDISTVRMSTINFELLASLAREIDQVQCEGLDSLSMSSAVSISKDIMESLFRNPWPLLKTTEHQLHLCSLTAQLLCLGIMVYAQAHIGKVHPCFLKKPVATIEIRGSSDNQSYIVAEQAELACMGEMIGDKIFVFRMSTQNLPTTAQKLYLNATCEEIVDSWGPAAFVLDPKEPSRELAKKLFGLVIRGGVIQPSGYVGNGERLFHWSENFNGDGPSSFGAFSYTDKIVLGATAPPIHFAIAQGIDEEGRDVRESSAWYGLEARQAEQLPQTRRTAQTRQETQHQEYRPASTAAIEPRAPQGPALGLIPKIAPGTTTHTLPQTEPQNVEVAVINSRCRRDAAKSYRASQSHRDPLGTTSSCWKFVSMQAIIQGGYQVLGQIGGEWQKQPGVPLKAVFLGRWGREMRLSDFELPLGLRVSLCTGVSQRVPLRELVRDGFMNYIDSLHISGWRELKQGARVAMASKELFSEWSDRLSDEERACAQKVFWHVLNCLKDTGFDRNGDNFSILWPYESDTSYCVKVEPKYEQEWFAILKDKEWSATFAVATDLCLETAEHSCRNKEEAEWTEPKILLTSMYLRVPVQDRRLIKTSSEIAWQIEDGNWYWSGERNATGWFLARKVAGAVTKLEFRKGFVDLTTKRVSGVVLKRTRGALAEVSDIHSVGEEVFVAV